MFALILLSSLALAACGGGPTSASGAGVVLRGTVQNANAAGRVGALSTTGTAAAGLTVTVVENRAITTTVNSDGSFTLRGLPEDGFTLEFSLNGSVIGTLSFDEVMPNQEITITVQVTATGVVLVEEQRNGIGHGDLEIEGLVQDVLSRSTTGDSRFRIDGRIVIARPGQTTIREGNTARTVNDITVGLQVHVKGVWMTGGTSSQEVLALEIKIQRDEGDDDGGNTKSCMISGGRVGDGIELEGNVRSGGASSFMLDVQGNRASHDVQVNAGGATFQCTPANGPNAPTPDQCRAKVTGGAKVHVSGRLQSCNDSSATVDAKKVIVQK